MWIFLCPQSLHFDASFFPQECALCTAVELLALCPASICTVEAARGYWTESSYYIFSMRPLALCRAGICKVLWLEILGSRTSYVSWRSIASTRSVRSVTPWTSFPPWFLVASTTWLLKQGFEIYRYFGFCNFDFVKIGQSSSSKFFYQLEDLCILV